MDYEIQIKFYRNSRNARKLAGIVGDFSHYELADDYQNPCFVYINKDCYPEDLQLVSYFWNIVKKYKETAMLANGRMLNKEQTDAILLWMACYGNREYFPDQSEYCFITPGAKSLHAWGCKWLHSVMRHGRFGRHRGVWWFTVGPFEDGIQHIDKQDIKDKLANEADAKCLQLCPVFSIEKAYQYVDLLPDQIDPKYDLEWEYEVSEDEVNKGAIIGVQRKTINIIDLHRKLDDLT